MEQTDHAEWVDQQRERQRRPQGDSWDPVPVPCPPTSPRRSPPRHARRGPRGAGRPSSARSSAVADQEDTAADPQPDRTRRSHTEDRGGNPGRSGARRAASARRSRERGRTPPSTSTRTETASRGQRVASRRAACSPVVSDF
ncbi:hypothetical protein LV779_16735 [Streptomyces thinghirensis]|nr:hypothetical protein [Streptomyces thinghirensis]